MFVVVRRYAAAGARVEEVARRVGASLVSMLRGLPGFRAYYCFVGEDGRAVSVSIVANRAAAVAANERAQEWVTANMADLIPGPPEVAMGEMLVDAATLGEGAADEGGGARAPEAPWADRGV